MSDLANIKLLVVDDEEVNLKIFKDILSRQKYEVLTVISGEEALSQLDQNSDIRMILLDIEMPGMDGLEVLQKVREKYSRKDLPVIMVTARDSSDTIVSALDLGANDYITKPIDLPVLMARIRTHLSLVE